MDGQRWISCRSGFFLPVRVLSRLFRRLFLQNLVAAHDAGWPQFFGDYARLADRHASMRIWRHGTEHHQLGVGDQRVEMSPSDINGFFRSLASACAQPTRKCPFEGVNSIDYRRREIALSTRNMLADDGCDAVAAPLPYFRIKGSAG